MERLAEENKPALPIHRSGLRISSVSYLFFKDDDTNCLCPRCFGRMPRIRAEKSVKRLRWSSARIFPRKFSQITRVIRASGAPELKFSQTMLEFDISWQLVVRWLLSHPPGSIFWICLRDVSSFLRASPTFTPPILDFSLSAPPTAPVRISIGRFPANFNRGIVSETIAKLQSYKQRTSKSSFWSYFSNHIWLKVTSPSIPTYF